MAKSREPDKIDDVATDLDDLKLSVDELSAESASRCRTEDNRYAQTGSGGRH